MPWSCLSGEILKSLFASWCIKLHLVQNLPMTQCHLCISFTEITAHKASQKRDLNLGTQTDGPKFCLVLPTSTQPCSSDQSQQDLQYIRYIRLWQLFLMNRWFFRDLSFFVVAQCSGEREERKVCWSNAETTNLCTYTVT